MPAAEEGREWDEDGSSATSGMRTGDRLAMRTSRVGDEPLSEWSVPKVPTHRKIGRVVGQTPRLTMPIGGGIQRSPSRHGGAARSALLGREVSWTG